MILILLGLPGSGKGTQGQLLAKSLKFPHLSIGDLLRELIKSGSPDGELLNNYISQGKLIPTEVVNEILRKRILSEEYKDSCILDGYPRNLAQAEFLSSIAPNNKLAVIYFEVDEQIIYQRLLGRFTCAKCNRIYNSYFDRLSLENTCDVCGSHDFVYRTDDDKSIINKRMEEYKLETFPLIDYYKKLGNLYVIDANKAKEEIESELKELVKKI